MEFTCPNCGAPVHSEVCKYCGSRLSIDSSQAELEYPEFKGKNMSDLKSHMFMLYFGAFWEAVTAVVHIPFMVFGGVMFDDNLIDAVFKYGFFGLFHTVGFICLFTGIRLVLTYYNIMSKGEDVIGRCYGYTKDKVKVLIPINGSPMFLFMYNGSGYRPYAVNSIMRFKVKGNKYIFTN